MDWETYLLLSNYRAEREAEEKAEADKLRDWEDERDYYAQFDD